MLAFPFYCEDGKLKISRWKTVFSLSLLSFTLAFNVYQLIYVPFIGPGWSLLSAGLFRSSEISKCAYLFSFVSLSVKSRTSIVQFMRNLHEARILANGINVFQKIEISYPLVRLECVTLAIYCASTLPFRDYNDPYTLFSTVIWYYTSSASTALLTAHWLLLKSVADLIATLNSRISLRQRRKQFKFSEIELCCCSDVHHLIVSAVESLSKTTGLPIVFLFIGCFLQILATCRVVVAKIHTNNRNFRLVALLIVLVCGSIVKIWYLVSEASVLKNEVHGGFLMVSDKFKN